jgi:trigger factor
MMTLLTAIINQKLLRCGFFIRLWRDKIMHWPQYFDNEMTVQVLRDEKFKKEYEVTISAADIQAEKEAWILANAKDMRVDGFRPGKAPMVILMKNYGEKAHEKAVNKLLKSSHDAIVTQHKLESAELKNVDQTQQTAEGESYKISFAVPPEFDLIDPKTITVENLQFKMPEDQIETMIAAIQFESGEKTWREKEDSHIIQENDIVYYDVKVYEKDALIHEGEELKIMVGVPETNACLALIQKEVIGHKIGDTVTIDKVKMKDILGYFSVISGKTVKFVLEITGITSVKKAELNAELFARCNSKNLDEFKAWVVKLAAATHISEIEMCHKRYIFDALDKAYTFELPADDLEEEFKKVWNQFLEEKKDFEAKGKTHPDMEGKTEDAVKEEYRAVAGRRIRLGHILAKTRIAEKIELTGEDIPNYIRNHIGHPESEEAQRWFGYMKTNKDFRAMYLEMMLEDKIAIVLHSKATHKNVEVSSEELSKRLSSIMPD